MFTHTQKATTEPSQTNTTKQSQPKDENGKAFVLGEGGGGEGGLAVPRILSLVAGYLHIILLPEQLKVVVEGLVVLGRARELGRGPCQDLNILWRDNDPGGI